MLEVGGVQNITLGSVSVYAENPTVPIFDQYKPALTCARPVSI